MNKPILLFLVLLASFTTTAQPASRLIRETKGSFNLPTSLYNRSPDTIYYRYSNGRGSNTLSGLISYDTALCQGTNTYTSICTYDAQNRQITKATIGYYITLDTSYYSGSYSEPDSVHHIDTRYADTSGIFFYYDASRNLIKSVKRNLSGLALDSVNSNYSGGNLMYTDHYLYSSSSLKPSEKLSYAYNTNNTIASTTYEYNYNTPPGLKNHTKHNYIYNSSNDAILDSQFIWNTVTSAWKLTNITYSVYDAAHNKLSDSALVYTGTTVQNTLKITRTWNSYNQPLTKLNQGWNSTTGAWGYYTASSSDSLHTYTYELYFPTGINNHYLGENNIKVYPVPANKLLNIQIENYDGNAGFTILDINSKIYRHWNSKISSKTINTIPLHDLPNGNYFLNINCNGLTTTKQLIILNE